MARVVIIFLITSVIDVLKQREQRREENERIE